MRSPNNTHTCTLQACTRMGNTALQTAGGSGHQAGHATNLRRPPRQDFGLSKVVGDGQTQGLELTSQGAGTYWCAGGAAAACCPNLPPLFSLYTLIAKSEHAHASRPRQCTQIHRSSRPAPPPLPTPTHPQRYLPPECFAVGQHGAAPMISNKARLGRARLLRQ